MIETALGRTAIRGIGVDVRYLDDAAARFAVTAEPVAFVQHDSLLVIDDRVLRLVRLVWPTSIRQRCSLPPDVVRLV